VSNSSSHNPQAISFETSPLSDDEKKRACPLAKTGGADFIKTSTGFAKGGATVEDVALIRKIVEPSMGGKASGGIRTREDALALIVSGANRLGTSAGIHIVTEWKDPASSTYKGSHSS
jgi:deoxyribose-phosphate aldolase